MRTEPQRERADTQRHVKGLKMQVKSLHGSTEKRTSTRTIPVWGCSAKLSCKCAPHISAPQRERADTQRHVKGLKLQAKRLHRSMEKTHIDTHDPCLGLLDEVVDALRPTAGARRHAAPRERVEMQVKSLHGATEKHTSTRTIPVKGAGLFLHPEKALCRLFPDWGLFSCPVLAWFSGWGLP